MIRLGIGRNGFGQVRVGWRRVTERRPVERYGQPSDSDGKIARERQVVIPAFSV